MSKKKAEEQPKKKRDMSKAIEARRAKARERDKMLTDRVQKILANQRVDPELKLKLGYCQDQIVRGPTEGSYVVTRRDELICEAERRFGFTA